MCFCDFKPIACFTRSQSINDVYCLQDMEIDKTNPMLWERVSELSTSGIVNIVNFGKKIPGFDKLSTNDQITLLKASCLEVMVSVEWVDHSAQSKWESINSKLFTTWQTQEIAQEHFLGQKTNYQFISALKLNANQKNILLMLPWWP